MKCKDMFICIIISDEIKKHFNRLQGSVIYYM